MKITAKNISKSFKKKVLFKDLSFEINKGDKVCITADSGKGKSTLLKILLGLETFQNGSILIDGKELNSENIQEIRKNIAWLPQDLSINIEQGFELIELLKIDKKLFISYLKQLGITESLLNQNFQSLSGGQKQRLLLASCLSLEKPLLFVDEPTSALDKNAISLLIKTIWKKKNITLISASHNKGWIDACSLIIKL